MAQPIPGIGSGRFLHLVIKNQLHIGLRFCLKRLVTLDDQRVKFFEIRSQLTLGFFKRTAHGVGEFPEVGADDVIAPGIRIQPDGGSRHAIDQLPGRVSRVGKE